MIIKKSVTVKISVHWIQADIIEGLKSGDINLSKHSLREIAEIIKEPTMAPQKIKHHLYQLVKLGILHIIDGQYKYNP